ncbi:Protein DETOXIFICATION 23 [Glycine max]|nr:Protein DETOXIFICATION 23 [Glycine max]
MVYYDVVIRLHGPDALTNFTPPQRDSPSPSPLPAVAETLAEVCEMKVLVIKEAFGSGYDSSEYHCFPSSTSPLHIFRMTRAKTRSCWIHHQMRMTMIGMVKILKKASFMWNRCLPLYQYHYCASFILTNLSVLIVIGNTSLKCLLERCCSTLSVEKEESLRKRAWEESKKMWVVAGPTIFTRFSTFGIMVVSQSFIGHIGSTELATYAIVMTVLVRSLKTATSKTVIVAPSLKVSTFHNVGIYDGHPPSL